jgi:sugar/nucleoside kinase (ribokinase family)
MMAKADLVFMNRAEGEILKDLIPEIPFVVVKKDAEGAELYQRGGLVRRVSAPRVTVVDVTGAGDVFAGTLLGRIASGQTIVAALQDAVETASLSVTQEGVAHLLPR